jgi:hypothetical protein
LSGSSEAAKPRRLTRAAQDVGPEKTAGMCRPSKSTTRVAEASPDAGMLKAYAADYVAPGFKSPEKSLRPPSYTGEALVLALP